MNPRTPKRNCGIEILAALSKGSFFDIDTLQKMIEPTIQKKNLRQALGILRKKGLVDMLVGDHRTFFYQLSQSDRVRNEVASKIGVHSSELVMPLFRRQDRYHNQWCDYWAARLKDAFPDVEIVREHTIGGHQLAKELLLANDSNDDLLPDVLVVFPKTDTTERVAIAFEIERTRKSDKRILRKFKKYLNETRIDGLVYVCDSGRLSETIRTLYETKLLAKAHRVAHYKEHFFLLSSALSASPDPMATFQNVNRKPVSLVDWCNTLRSTKLRFRRETQFG